MKDFAFSDLTDVLDVLHKSRAPLWPLPFAYMILILATITLFDNKNI